MMFRRANPSDVPHICALESIPEFRSFVGSWPEDQHLRMLADPDAAYIVAEDKRGQIAGFAVLLGLRSEHKSVELKRIVVSVPNQGMGRKLLTVIADRAFNEHRAHRLWLDVFASNDRARHVYESFGFRTEGMLREAVYRDGAYHSLFLMSLLDSEYQSVRKAPQTNGNG
jgi:RimJ/RimL family protein N-acetyltransferase